MESPQRENQQEGSEEEEEEEESEDNAASLQDELQEFRQRWQRELQAAGQLSHCVDARDNHNGHGVEDQVGQLFSFLLSAALLVGKEVMGTGVVPVNWYFYWIRFIKPVYWKQNQQSIRLLFCLSSSRKHCTVREGMCVCVCVRALEVMRGMLLWCICL